MSIVKTEVNFGKFLKNLLKKKHKEGIYLTVNYLLMLVLNTQEAQERQSGHLCNLATARLVVKLLNVKFDLGQNIYNTTHICMYLPWASFLAYLAVNVRILT